MDFLYLVCHSIQRKAERTFPLHVKRMKTKSDVGTLNYRNYKNEIRLKLCELVLNKMKYFSWHAYRSSVSRPEFKNDLLLSLLRTSAE
jgi:hypothetical protein